MNKVDATENFDDDVLEIVEKELDKENMVLVHYVSEDDNWNSANANDNSQRTLASSDDDNNIDNNLDDLDIDTLQIEDIQLLRNLMNRTVNES